MRGPHLPNSTLAVFITQTIKRLKEEYGYEPHIEHLFKSTFLIGGYTYVGIDVRTGEIAIERDNNNLPVFSNSGEMASKLVPLGENRPLLLGADKRGPRDYSTLGLTPDVREYYEERDPPKKALSNKAQEKSSKK